MFKHVHAHTSVHWCVPKQGPPQPAPWGAESPSPPQGCPYLPALGLGAHASRCPRDPRSPCRRGTLSTLPPAHQHPGSPRVSPPASPQPGPRLLEVPVQRLRRCRGVQGVPPLTQHHGAVGPAAPGCCQREPQRGCRGPPHALPGGTPTLPALPVQVGCRQQVQRPARKVPAWQVGSMASLALLARRSAQSHCHSSWALCGDREGGWHRARHPWAPRTGSHWWGGGGGWRWGWVMLMGPLTGLGTRAR